MSKNKTTTTSSEVPSNPEPTPPEPSKSEPTTIATPEPKKSYVPTSQTGLQDYSYWCQYVKDQAKKSDKDPKSFRRGRIWA
ncbi:cyanobactin biosynthesis PatC/TenC/TruC family protein [Limnoraphis robusta Tam1]|jgi:cyanobactin cluster PatC/TenC/TruC protein|uniref:cyanobactin biosynthesis PatC/TenC/TruC family protein n=1 Tax=Limnoraphis robusta TaxID=1118279 RepID=UPI002B1F221E|nr:cyanobactin biosynthesis PatC/TenC/TruC family protein [Limnoraphis robusta]MEA5539686.1 cyanobactin biosynthesis PatC/TenC/TruC family protein [Limnoraphis robusta Tam1]